MGRKLCSRCKRVSPVRGRSRCSPCVKVTRRNEKRQRLQRKLAGKCHCGRKIRNKRKTCKRCLLYAGEYQRKRRRSLRPHRLLKPALTKGNCPRCSRRDVEPGHTSCGQCLKYMRDYSRTHPRKSRRIATSSKGSRLRAS